MPETVEPVAAALVLMRRAWSLSSAKAGQSFDSAVTEADALVLDVVVQDLDARDGHVRVDGPLE